MTILAAKKHEMTPFGQLVETEDGSLTICHSAHAQNFHSTEGARLEAWQLYVVASGFLSEMSHPGHQVHVLDVGMGLGYNAAATIAAWVESSGDRDLRIVSLEVDELLVESVASGAAPWFLGWQDAWLLGPKALMRVSACEFMGTMTHGISGKSCTWQILVGDGVKTLSCLTKGEFDYIWQDPFTPDLNPTMWSPAWFSALRERSAPEARLMTYSVARTVRDGLEGGGWLSEKIKTPTRKRQWTRAMNRVDGRSKKDRDLVEVRRP